MLLNFKKVGAGDPLIILHGLFGSLDNWTSISKVLGEHYEVFLVDARNHGKSPHSDVFNYDAMADDLYAFLLHHNITDPIIIGHSMGGKTAMQFAMNYPTHLSKLIVVDIAPKAYPIHHQKIIEGLSALDFNAIKTRKEADQQLSTHISDLSTRQFLLKNLYWIEKDRLAWKFNLPIISSQIANVGEELQNKIAFAKPTLFIGAERSNYILENDHPLIHEVFENATIETVLDCGHWVHAEKPKELIELVLKFSN